MESQLYWNPSKGFVRGTVQGWGGRPGVLQVEEAHVAGCCCSSLCFVAVGLVQQVPGCGGYNSWFQLAYTRAMMSPSVRVTKVEWSSSVDGEEVTPCFSSLPCMLPASFWPQRPLVEAPQASTRSGPRMSLVMSLDFRGKRQHPKLGKSLGN